MPFFRSTKSLLMVLATMGLASLGCTSGGAAQPSATSDPGTNIIKDSMGMCQMTVPDGWRPGKTGEILAYGPEGSKATVLVGAGTGAWEHEKAMVKALYFGQELNIIQDDLDTLIFEGTPPTGQGYLVVGARPIKDHYCWVEITAAAPDAREKRAGDFRKIAESVKGLW